MNDKVKIPVEGQSLSKILLSAIKEPLLLVDRDGQLIFLNQSLRAQLGLHLDASLPDIHEIWPDFTLAQLRFDSQSTRLKHVTNSATLEFSYIAHKLVNASWLILLEDAYGKQKNFHAERLRTLGILAGGVAHDFNNILTGILGHVSYLKAILPANGAHSESLSAVEEGSKKASTITQQILNFSRLRTVEEFTRVDVTELTQKTVLLLRGAIPPRYEVRTNLAKTSLYIDGVEGRLAQVLVNLVMNARAALGDDGIIEISVSSEEVDGEKLVVLKVADNGEGIPAEVLERIFEPYFSTKVEGTGLGLATVADIVSEHSGEIAIDSEVGKGTTVTVRLPMLLPAQAEISRGPAPLLGGNERVLIIDDEASVRSVISMSLSHLGYQVEVAMSGVEAVELFKTKPDGYDLVIVDMLMPKLSGEEVFFELRRLNPEVQVLMISGYSSEESIDNVLASGGRGFIQKPFTIDQLASKVRECLDT